MARLYADENFDHDVVRELRRLGHDVVTVQELGRQRRLDPAVLADATAAGRAVLTFDHSDFQRLHRSGAPHAGIVSCTEDDDKAALAARIDAKLAAADPSAGRPWFRITRPRQPPALPRLSRSPPPD